MGKKKALFFIQQVATLLQSVLDYIIRVEGDGGVVESPECIEGDSSAHFHMQPSGYKPTVLYSQKPVEEYGPEKVINGTFDTDTNWITEGNWQITDGTLNKSANDSSRSYQSYAHGGKTYLVSFDVVEYISGTARINLGNSSPALDGNAVGHYSGIRVGSGANNIYINNGGLAFNGAIDNISVKEVLVENGDFTVERASTRTRINSEGNREVLADDVPALDYTFSDCPVLSLEPQRTNLIEESKDLTTWWVTTNGAEISDDGTTVLGRQSDLFIGEDAFASPRVIRSAVSPTDNNNYITQATIIPKGVRYIILARSTSLAAFSRVIFDLETLTFTDEGGGIIDKGFIQNRDGSCTLWTKVESAGASSNSMSIGFSADGLDNNYTGNGTDGAYVTDIGVTQGEYFTSIIDTSGGTATRLITEVFGAGDSNAYNSEEGVLYVDMRVFENTQGGSRMSLVSNAIGSEAIIIGVGAGTDLHRLVVVQGGAYVVDEDIAATDVTQFSKLALAFTDLFMQFWIDGVMVYETLLLNNWAPGTFIVGTLSSLASTVDVHGENKGYRYYNTLLTTQELQDLTT